MARKANMMQRGKSWVVYFRADGQQVWKSFKVKEEAERYLAEERLKLARGEYHSPVKVTFREFAAKWLRHTEGRVAAKTFEGYEGVLRVHVLPEFGERQLTQITLEALDEFLGDWLAGGPHFRERERAMNELEKQKAAAADRPARKVTLGRSPKTVANAVVPLKSMLSQAVRWHYLSSSPAAEVRRPRVERSHDEMRPLTPAEIRKLVDAGPSPEAKTLLLLAATTGMRRGEVLGLRWGDVDHSAGRVWVRRSIGKDGRAQQPKSQRSVRAIAATPTLLSELRLHRMRSEHKSEDDYVFASEAGTPLDGNNMVRRYLAPALRKAGMEAIRFHDLRHTFASLLIAQGEHPKLISEQLGHASVQITLDRYGHLMDQSYGDASGRLEAVLFGPRSEAFAVGR